MFREIGRNKKQILSEDRVNAILEKSTSGVLALIGDNGYTYGVPMSYGYSDGKLYFHSALKGHKVDAIKKHDLVSFTIIETDQVVPAEFTTYYRSVIVFGKIHPINDAEGKREALSVLVKKYSPDYIEEGRTEIEDGLSGVQIFALDIEHMSGKEAMELTGEANVWGEVNA